MDRFEEAVVAFEKIEPEGKEANYWDFWVNYNRLPFLISACAGIWDAMRASKARFLPLA